MSVTITRREEGSHKHIILLTSFMSGSLHHADAVHAVQVLPERRAGQVLGEGVQAGDGDAEAGGRRVQAVEGVGQEGAEGGRVGEEG